MSPEQIEDGAGAVGPASDIYSLGVMLYELLTGHLPFAGSVASVIGQIVTREPPPPSERRPDLDPRLEGICLKMMAKQPAQRYATMEAVSDALDGFLRNRGESETLTSASQPTAAVNRVRELPPAPPAEAPASTAAALPPDMLGRVSIPRSLFWGAIAMIATGFGLTWWMMSIALEQREDLSNRIEFDNSFRQALQEQAATLYIDGNAVDQQQLDTPVPLEPGSHHVEIRKGDEVMLTQEYTVADGQSSVLNIKYADGNFVVREDVTQEAGSNTAEPESEAASENSGASQAPAENQL
jgi:serine/threonine protein kinase